MIKIHITFPIEFCGFLEKPENSFLKILLLTLPSSTRQIEQSSICRTEFTRAVCGTVVYKEILCVVTVKTRGISVSCSLPHIHVRARGSGWPSFPLSRNPRPSAQLPRRDRRRSWINQKPRWSSRSHCYRYWVRSRCSFLSFPHLQRIF